MNLRRLSLSGSHKRVQARRVAQQREEALRSTGVRAARWQQWGACPAHCGYFTNAQGGILQRLALGVSPRWASGTNSLGP